jgi:hypothetical protein
MATDNFGYPIGPGRNDGVEDPYESKIENTPENYAHQIAWDAEVLGYAPLAKEPTPKRSKSRLRRALQTLGRILEQAGAPYDPYATF